MKAIAILFDNKFRPTGSVLFDQKSPTSKTDIFVQVASNNVLSGGLHGFHIHESGDLSEHCASLCAHYNPYQSNHGGPRSKERHVGDLGNVRSDGSGFISQKMSNSSISLYGKYSIIGRSVIIHKDEDDLGKGGNDESLKTGNAGKRVLCGVIGYRKGCV